MGELVTTERGKSELELMLQQEQARDERAFQYIPVRYRIASQAGVFQNASDESEILPAMEGIILMSRIVRAYWPRGNTERRPVCSSIGGTAGDWRNPDGSVRQMSCATCPYNRWGSDIREDGTAGRGKACKEMRRFLMLLAGYEMPVVLTIPPTSCRAFDLYASALATKGSAYFAVETRIALQRVQGDGGQRYSVATFNLIRKLNEEELAWVVGLRRQFETVLGTAPEYEEYADEPDPDASWRDE